MTDGYTVAHLLPRDTPRQRVAESVVNVTPEPSERDEHVDAFGNRVTQFGVHHPHDELIVEAVSTSDVDDPVPIDDAESWNDVAARVDRLRGDEAVEIGPFRARTRFVDLDRVGAELAAIAYGSFTPGRGIGEAASDLCHRIFDEFTYDSTATDVSSPLADVLASRRGVCQDFAHLAAGCLRSIGLAARYVSGYIETDPPAGRDRLVGADASHALVLDLDTIGGLDRLRSDERPLPDPPPCHRCVGTRLRRRHTGPWRRDRPVAGANARRRRRRGADLTRSIRRESGASSA